MTDDLTALRRMAEENARIAEDVGNNSGSISFATQFVLSLLDRLERAERELEVAMAPHSDCVESGERAGAQIDDLKSRAERAEAAIERVRELHGFDGGYCKSCAIPFHECDIANALADALDTGKETGSAESS